MALIDTNLASDQLKNLLDRDGDTAKINYGFNTGGAENYVYFVTKDGGALAIDTVIAEINNVDFTDSDDPQWYLVGHAINEEDENLTDDHTGRPIPSMYG
ncbi:hypothetical protein [Gordonia sihwensis]|uniref:hypothetical protein n=1 Tax=Gordonia sihwensis TaxID=173559 RepID=UPI003D97B78E